MKNCFKCGEDKPFSEFYRHPQMADGFLGKCKSCAKADVRERRKGPARDKVLAYDRWRGLLPHRVEARQAYNRSPDGRATHAAALSRQVKKSPEKYAARVKLGNAVRVGLIIRQPCSVCGETKSEGHHEDYSKPLDVIWLCNKHHRERHKEMKAKME